MNSPKPLRVGFPLRHMTSGGVTRYMLNLLEALQKRTDIQCVVFTDKPELIKNLPQVETVFVPPAPRLLWDYIHVVPLLRKASLDWVVYTKNIIPFTDRKSPYKKAVVAYDMAYFEKSINEYKFFDTIYMRRFMKSSFQRADLVCAISEATRTDIIRRLKISPSKIMVVYGAPDRRTFYPRTPADVREVMDKYAIRRPYFLYCGTLTPRKNILRTLQAFERVRNEVPQHFYIATRTTHSARDIVRYVQNYLSDRVTFLPFVSDADLGALYSGADAFLYPSLYEGFGLPIVEAQACEVPVLTSNAYSCPEAAGEGAYIVDPYSIEQIKQALRILGKDSVQRQQLIAHGLQNVRRFTWDTSAHALTAALAAA